MFSANEDNTGAQFFHFEVDRETAKKFESGVIKARIEGNRVVLNINGADLPFEQTDHTRKMYNCNDDDYPMSYEVLSVHGNYIKATTRPMSQERQRKEKVEIKVDESNALRQKEKDREREKELRERREREEKENERQRKEKEMKDQRDREQRKQEEQSRLEKQRREEEKKKNESKILEDKIGDVVVLNQDKKIPKLRTSQKDKEREEKKPRPIEKEKPKSALSFTIKKDPKVDTDELKRVVVDIQKIQQLFNSLLDSQTYSDEDVIKLNRLHREPFLKLTKRYKELREKLHN
ncbi:hypothetical protein EIN_416980 [Entamoeba invadens IP1]|uniref:Uncharacterized protein n=1 Tax=Entamoeba invadens IP1 TaxID=370355 RepID=A0A0A1TYM2_ENTIV|nr:hypothetical protein EIN_416980 [Entamoeba invadens IP1]ELP83619.1 hypothetical protein EIN_416980 [Entamoeba invadens IP1]|eukprot:XP_004182965.1 hypothetical protein EIN_416980 [Entamoeba invadens IP1]